MRVPGPIEMPTIGRRRTWTDDLDGDGATGRKAETQSEVALRAEGTDVPPVENRSIRQHVLDDDRRTIGPDDRTLLIVEDDSRFARIIADVARESDWKVLCATHAEEALKLAKRFRPTGITLDVKLPGTHGLVLLDQLKNDAETRHVPVTILSVDGDLAARRPKGVFRRLTKPVTREQVAASVAEMQTFAERKAQHLLVVQADESERHEIAELLQGSDLEIETEASGEDAVAAIERASFDGFVIDSELPDMPGQTLLDQIRAKLGDVPTVVLARPDVDAESIERLRAIADTVVVNGVQGMDRLLYETTLLLHRDEEGLSDEARRRLRDFDAAQASLSGRKVLVIDDDIRNIFAISSLLGRYGMDIRHAESGLEGLAVLNGDLDVDVVLIDIMMPRLDGYECMRRIRKNPRFKDLPIIAVTAKAMAGDREKCIAAGASDYVTKPVNVEQLISVLRLWVAR